MCKVYLSLKLSNIEKRQRPVKKLDLSSEMMRIRLIIELLHTWIRISLPGAFYNGTYLRKTREKANIDQI